MLKRIICTLVVALICVNLCGCKDNAKNDTPIEWVKQNYGIIVITNANEYIINGIIANWSLWSRMRTLPGNLDWVEPSAKKIIDTIENDCQSNKETIKLQNKIIKISEAHLEKVEEFRKGKSYGYPNATMSSMLRVKSPISEAVDIGKLMNDAFECSQNSEKRKIYMP